MEKYNIKDIQEEISQIQKQYKSSNETQLKKHNQLLKKQIQLLKTNQKTLKKQLDGYRKVVFQSCQQNISQVLQMQHTKIFQLQTQLQILQNKYDKLLNKSGSSTQTEYAIKCKQLQRQLEKNTIQHQKQMAVMKDKLMKMNANSIKQSSSSNFNYSNNLNPISSLNNNINNSISPNSTNGSIKRTITSPQEIISPNRNKKFV